ncbi:hypothetical protein EDB84DRAFT_1494886 [Lactarius hengduanensis]|nr:hypothetical protein EDB84DRAFT_1494886 [Lactarius hengduanensis]
MSGLVGSGFLPLLAPTETPTGWSFYRHITTDNRTATDRLSSVARPVIDGWNRFQPTSAVIFPYQGKGNSSIKFCIENLLYCTLATNDNACCQVVVSMGSLLLPPTSSCCLSLSSPRLCVVVVALPTVVAVDLALPAVVVVDLTLYSPFPRVLWSWL